MDFNQTSQIQIVQSLLGLFHERLVVVALRDPYELSVLPDIGTYVCAFSFRPSACQAMVEVLCGEYLPTGKTPVTIPNTEFTSNGEVMTSPDGELGYINKLDNSQ